MDNETKGQRKMSKVQKFFRKMFSPKTSTPDAVNVVDKQALPQESLGAGLVTFPTKEESVVGGHDKWRSSVEISPAKEVTVDSLGPLPEDHEHQWSQISERELIIGGETVEVPIEQCIDARCQEKRYKLPTTELGSKVLAS